MKNPSDTFLKCMDDIVTTLKSEHHYAAAHVCRSMRNSFACFLTEEKKASSFLCLTAPLLKEYENWLKSHNRSYNTISTYLRSLRAAYYRILAASGLGKCDSALFHDVHKGVSSTGNRPIANRTVGSVLSGKGTRGMDSNLCTTCDLFQLQFLLCGMPYIDLYHLRKQDLRGNVLSYRRHKTGVGIVLIVPEPALALIRLHADKTSSSYLLRMDRKGRIPVAGTGMGTGMETGISKEELSYRAYQHSLRTYNAELGRLSAFLCLGEKLSSYSPRHTWANIAFHSNVPVGVVSRVMGHKSISTTELYLEPFREGEIEKVNNKIIRLAKKCATTVASA